ncbi:helix-turn-helix transcriptional regulator [Rosenbergiella epipactidis]|nr:helix-turn-helix transcriptional regulator [Rosenbergiella epipactidis]
MGTMPIRYLTAWRMRLASKALGFSGEAIKTLAFELGYKNESTFSVVFKRYYGHSPSQHRRLGPGVTLSGASKDKL